VARIVPDAELLPTSYAADEFTVTHRNREHTSTLGRTSAHPFFFAHNLSSSHARIHKPSSIFYEAEELCFMKSDSVTQSANGRGDRTLDVLRWGSVIGGGALALFGLTRRSKPGFALAAAGGLLAYRGATLDAADQEWYAESSFAINCAPEQAFQFWRNFENLPRFMRNLESVKVTGDRRSEWAALGRLGMSIRWSAEIVDEKQNEWIVWRSLEGSDIDCRGSVHFRSATGDRGTIVTSAMQCRPPAGAVGKTVAALFAKDPTFMMREDLRRFKALMESGEIPNVEGQTHGPRSMLDKAIHAAHPEKRKPVEFEANLQQLETQRSAS
jgi:uncharacterized membrane protein